MRQLRRNQQLRPPSERIVDGVALVAGQALVHAFSTVLVVLTGPMPATRGERKKTEPVRCCQICWNQAEPDQSTARTLIVQVVLHTACDSQAGSTCPHRRWSTKPFRATKAEQHNDQLAIKQFSDVENSVFTETGGFGPIAILACSCVSAGLEYRTLTSVQLQLAAILPFSTVSSGSIFAVSPVCACFCVCASLAAGIRHLVVTCSYCRGCGLLMRSRSAGADRRTSRVGMHKRKHMGSSSSSTGASSDHDDAMVPSKRGRFGRM